MATYNQIQKWIKENYGYVPKTCWIAHVKEICGMARRTSPNRMGPTRKYPCPDDKIDDIKKAFKFFGMG